MNSECRYNRRRDRYQLCAFVLIAVAMVIGFWRIENNASITRGLVADNSALIAGQHAQEHRSQRNICSAVNNLNKAITASLARSRRSLPKLSYYRHHHSELRAQIRSIDRELRRFRPRTCK